MVSVVTQGAQGEVPLGHQWTWNESKGGTCERWDVNLVERSRNLSANALISCARSDGNTSGRADVQFPTQTFLSHKEGASCQVFAPFVFS